MTHHRRITKQGRERAHSASEVLRKVRSAPLCQTVTAGNERTMGCVKKRVHVY